MPFTPFHMGPGAAIKAVSGRYFSLLVFGFAQVAMDIEPLLRIIRGDAVLHGFTHTYLGATLIAAVSVVLGRPCCRLLPKIWNLLCSPEFLRRLRISADISMPAAINGAIIGTYSHVFLDSIVHGDMQPWLPFSWGNGLLSAVPAGWLYLLCLVLGGIGVMVLLAVFVWNKIVIEE